MRSRLRWRPWKAGKPPLEREGLLRGRAEPVAEKELKKELENLNHMASELGDLGNKMLGLPPCTPTHRTTSCPFCKEKANELNAAIDELAVSVRSDAELAAGRSGGRGDRLLIYRDREKEQRLEERVKRLAAELDDCERFWCQRPHLILPLLAFVSTDGLSWCTYGDGSRTAVAFTPSDNGGVPVAFTLGTPPIVPDRPATSPGLPPPVADPPPVTSATPPRTERPPPTTSAPRSPPITTDTLPTPVTPPTADIPPTGDTPPQIPDTVFVKASQVVLEGGQTGSELQNQTVKLVFTKPDLPGTSGSKTAQDTGFDRDPAQCTTGANGQCKIEVHPEDRPLYGLASSGAKPSHYRLDLNLLKHSGAVAETTGKAKPDLNNATLAGGNIAASEFKVGNRKFTRLGIDQPHGRSDNFAALSRALGAAAETDYCRTKKPGPPLGLEPASLAALNHELPEAAAKLDGLLRAGRAVR